MKIEFDPNKEAANLEERHIPLEAARDFDFTTALQAVDDRRDYGETRIVALGHMGDRLHVLVYTMRGGVLRPISLRKANKRERKRYEKTL